MTRPEWLFFSKRAPDFTGVRHDSWSDSGLASIEGLACDFPESGTSDALGGLNLERHML